MKKLLIALSAFALSFTLAQAYHHGGDGSGPHSGSGGMWENMSGVDLPPELVTLRDEIVAERKALKISRDAALEGLADAEAIKAALEAWRLENADAISSIREKVGTLRDWFRENRPMREKPVVTEEMRQRRLQFKEKSQEIRQLRLQLEGLDPESEEYAQIRDQLRTLLQERKQMLRKRRLGGGVGGDRRPPQG
ncbi:MAG: hypothetical protein ACO3ZW_02980 [Opitutales bacterium]|jgi:post-segregation antitoxin (ccd killing protein)